MKYSVQLSTFVFPTLVKNKHFWGSWRLCTPSRVGKRSFPSPQGLVFLIQIATECCCVIHGICCGHDRMNLLGLGNVPWIKKVILGLVIIFAILALVEHSSPVTARVTVSPPSHSLSRSLFCRPNCKPIYGPFFPCSVVKPQSGSHPCPIHKPPRLCETTIQLP